MIRLYRHPLERLSIKRLLLLVFSQILPGYQLRVGMKRERESLLQFLQRSYQELFPEQNDFSHLSVTVKQYFSRETPLWWVEPVVAAVPEDATLVPRSPLVSEPIACLWMGNAIDQVEGNRYAHVFLLYVVPEYRRRGIGSALMRHAENWARTRGDRQIGLQVFQYNQPAITLYRQLGYQTQSLLMIKPLSSQSPE
jgi:ribosomal protein S18 acetylase RimI-like enzyme